MSLIKELGEMESNVSTLCDASIESAESRRYGEARQILTNADNLVSSYIQEHRGSPEFSQVETPVEITIAIIDGTMGRVDALERVGEQS